MIDAHLHLEEACFENDRGDLVLKAKQAGVNLFFSTSTRLENWERTLLLHKQDKAIIPFIGTHPFFADTHNDEMLKTLLEENLIAGVGEIGLDALKGKPCQEEVFLSQLKRAVEFSRPCSIHCVKSFHRILYVLKQLRNQPPALLFHGFNGHQNDVKQLLKYNAYFSFSAKSFLHKEKLKKLLEVIPKNRFLIETDAPFQLVEKEFQVNLEEKRNVPENLCLILKAFACITGIEVKDLSKQLQENADNFLKNR